MSLRGLQARARRLALSLLDDIAPGAAEVVASLEAWERQRETIEVQRDDGAVEHERAIEDEGDTILVEITDERGRFVGWTTAKKR